MQYDARTPTEYLILLAEDWRKEKLLAVRNLLKKQVPELNEGINGKMLAYSYKGNLFCCLNAQMNYVSFYFTDTNAVDPGRKLLKGKGVDVSKQGYIRMKKAVSFDEMQLEKFTIRAFKHWKKSNGIES